MIVQNYAILLVLRASPTAGKFPNAVKLFRSWNERLDQQDLLVQLAKLQSKGGVTHRLLPPLGTDIA